MIKKMNIIFFIFLTVFLINSVSAEEVENKTILTENTPQSINIETHDVEMYYKDGTRFTANIYDENENPLNNSQTTFSLNSMDYTRQTNENGESSLAINLDSGKYNIKTSVNEISVNNTITIKSTIYSSDLAKIYRNSTQYQAKFLDKYGENLKNTAVTFNIHGVFYTRITDENGIAKLNINLNPSNYILTAIHPNGEMKSNNITVLPTITNNRDVVKYYRNATQYSVSLLEKNGEYVGSGHEVEFNINGVFYIRQTNIQGIATLNLNLEPGDYIITAQYEGCMVSNNIKILPTLTAKDITMEYKDGTKFKAHLVDGQGKPAAYEKVTFNINGVLYTRTTNDDGIASLNINLQTGEYIITSQHNFLSISNIIKINAITPKQEVIKNTNFTYEIHVPNYVNVTLPYVFSNNVYSLKDGINGIIRMEKNQLIEIQIGYKYYIYSTGYMPEYSATYLGSEYILLPFDNTPTQHSYRFEDLSGNGIILYRSLNYTHFIYRNNCSSNIEQFGAYTDKGLDKSEIINFIQNGENIAKIKFQTMSFDELGLKYSLSKSYGKTIYDFNYESYEEIMKENIESIKFAKTNDPVEFDYFGRKIVGYISEEDITAKFNSKNCIEFEKEELITYGLSDKYKQDFDIMHSFAIINKKITNKELNEWIEKENEYKSDVGMQSIYTMFLTSLNTAYLSDKLSDDLCKNYSLKWSRTNNVVILGGMNWKETYQHILTPDMGRLITGDNESDIIKFRFVNSILLSKIEQFSLKPVAQDADVNITSVFDEIFNSMADYKTSIVYYNNTAIIADESGNSTFVIDLTTGLVTPLAIKDGFAYKGVTITRDCGLCSIYSMAKEVTKEVSNGIQLIDDVLTYIKDNILPLASITIKGTILGKGIVGAIVGSGIGVGLNLLGTALSIQALGVYYVDNYVDDKDVYTAYDHVTFTRPGYMQNSKIYNIPKEDGSVDYIEIPINRDNSLDRDNVKYISKGNVKTLTKQETYQYFDEETWEPFNVPKKYWR